MNIEEYISHFETIDLDTLSQVNLMNRIDRKFFLHRDKIAPILTKIYSEYRILEERGERNLPYVTTYYDTANSDMFIAHHNGKLNRYKIRHREYTLSNCSFLEVKFKSNKGRTVKKRIPSMLNSRGFSKEEIQFINSNTPFDSQNLNISLINEFSRVTLVNNQFTERCTIDFNLNFRNNDDLKGIEDLVIIEIKTVDSKKSSHLIESLSNVNIKSSGFSKYCIGRTLLNTAPKMNAFKPRIRQLEQVLTQ